MMILKTIDLFSRNRTTESTLTGPLGVQYTGSLHEAQNAGFVFLNGKWLDGVHVKLDITK